MSRHLSGIFLSLFLFLFSSLANAGIIIGGTRVIYISDHADETISIINKDEAFPYLIQAWGDPFDSNDKSKPPFTVIPPVSRLDPLQEKVLRIMKTKGALPEDRESVFWLNIKNIPPASNRKTTNTLEIAIKTRIKLFWRPASLNVTPESVALKMKWRVDNHQLIVENPSPIHINIMDVAVDGKDIPLNIIRPFETLRLPLPTNVVGHNVIWHFVDDRGAISQDIKIKL